MVAPGAGMAWGCCCRISLMGARFAATGLAAQSQRRGGKGNQVLRLICTSAAAAAAAQRKNVAASGPEKYTEAFIKKQIEEFNIGKRHLANMMGKDPETFTQEDVDDTYRKFLDIQKHEDHMRAQDVSSDNTAQINLIGSRWLIKEELEEMLVEELSDQDHRLFIQLLERILTQPYCSTEEEYVLKFRKQLDIESKKLLAEPLQYDEQGVAFSTGAGQRKTARATVVLYDKGTGKITVNGIDYLEYFPVLQHREQLMFPFQFLDRLGKHDMTCTVSDGGKPSQAGAIRLASSKALMSFVAENEIEFMRQAGLLTIDPRVRERKKPGQEGARRKFTWKKR
ncbi:28S ribosomal protein S9, mitochondrial isoform X3 [Rhinatrema bivittatum]|uniref:28S ribosomal protein S9, mitochondrial isoform X3 n=1 Tax=Rhinatrema bivittatum TaxID=194408 RepID=UPI00112BF5D3|nr:28S ribosomal protein S9, mitochondrial isoform X3 [Rhinatrema bivittatum]